MSYRQSIQVLAAALCAEARALNQPDGTAATALPGMPPTGMEDYFLSITEKALEAVPNDALIAILGGRMRSKLEQAGFSMDAILPATESGESKPPATQSAKVYRLRA